MKIQGEFRRVLIQLIKSHNKLSSAEYKRDRTYNNQHFSAIAETDLIAWLLENDRELLDECCKKIG